MTGLQMLRDSIKSILNRNEQDIDRKYLEQKLQVYEKVADFTQEDCYILFDTGIFNDILIAYAVQALNNTGLSEHANDVRQEISNLLDSVGAEKIITS